jgi:hypothetical protein
LQQRKGWPIDIKKAVANLYIFVNNINTFSFEVTSKFCDDLGDRFATGDSPSNMLAATHPIRTISGLVTGHQEFIESLQLERVGAKFEDASSCASWHTATEPANVILQVNKMCGRCLHIVVSCHVLPEERGFGRFGFGNRWLWVVVSFAKIVLSLAVVMSGIIAAVLLSKVANDKLRWKGFFAKNNRLELLGRLVLDSKRYMVLIKCDDSEYLILCGQAGDKLVGYNKCPVEMSKDAATAVSEDCGDGYGENRSAICLPGTLH